MPVNKDSIIKINNLVNSQLIDYFTKQGPVTVSFLNGQELLILPEKGIEIQFSGDLLKISLPVHISTNLKAPVRLVKVESKVIVSMEASLTWEDQNNFKITSRITDLSWIGDMAIQPALLDFIIPDNYVKEMVEKQIPAINDKINQTLNEAANLNTLLERRVWARTVNVALKDKQTMNFSIKPKLIEIFKIGFEANVLRIGVNLEVLVHPSARPEKPDRLFKPKVILLQEAATEGELGIGVGLVLDTLDIPVLKVIKSYTNVENAIGSTIEKIIIRTVNEDGIAIALKLKGSLNGGLSIGGKPIIDPENLVLYFENLSFDFSSKNILSSLKGNIALSVAKSVIRKQFPISLKSYVESLISATNEVISEVHLFDGIVLKSNISDWKLEDISIQNGYLRITASTYLSTFLSSGKA